MDYKVIDLIRALYVACDGNLEMPIEGVCLSGGEKISIGHEPSYFANGKLKRGTLFGYMNVAIHKTAREKWEGDGYEPTIAIQRGGISDVYMFPEKLNKMIKI